MGVLCSLFTWMAAVPFVGFRRTGGRFFCLLALMAALAAMLGLAMVWTARRGDRAFYSADQVGHELALPVVGTFAAGKFSAGRLAHSVHRGARTTCEGLMALVAIWLVMLAALDRSFLLEVTGDPLAAIALAWQHTMG